MQFRPPQGRGPQRHRLRRLAGLRARRRLVDPVCFGSAAALGGALYLAYCNDPAQRRNECVRESRDGGRPWSEPLLLDAARGGYVEIAADPVRNRLYVLYEGNFGERGRFVQIAPPEDPGPYRSTTTAGNPRTP